MNILVACEFSGTVRDAFIARGHNAVSCDLLPTASPGPHFQCDVETILDLGWDMMIAHPPCTHLAVSGARYFAEKRAKGIQQAALSFVRRLMRAPVPLIAIENPVSVISTYIRKPTQVIQPWMFGHPEMKTTCLWLKGLPKLSPTDNVWLEMMSSKTPSRILALPPSNDRWALRSLTYKGIAAAMAAQWG